MPDGKSSMTDTLACESIELNTSDGSDALISGKTELNAGTPVGSEIMVGRLAAERRELRAPDGRSPMMDILACERTELSRSDGSDTLISGEVELSAETSMGSKVIAGRLGTERRELKIPDGRSLMAETLASERIELSTSGGKGMLISGTTVLRLGPPVGDPVIIGRLRSERIELRIPGGRLLTADTLASARMELSTFDGKAVPMSENIELIAGASVGNAVRVERRMSDKIELRIPDGRSLIAGTLASEIIELRTADGIPERSELMSGTLIGNDVTTGGVTPDRIELSTPDGRSLIAVILASAKIELNRSDGIMDRVGVPVGN